MTTAISEAAPKKRAPTTHESERLAIYVIKHKDYSSELITYVSIPTGVDWPWPAVVATVLEDGPGRDGPHLSMLLTNDIMRRRGYGTDMLEWLDAHYGMPLTGDGVTDDGEAFLDAIWGDGGTESAVVGALPGAVDESRAVRVC